MEYICIFAMLFLGVFGAASFTMSLCGFFGEYSSEKPVTVRPKNSDDLEYKVRNALISSNGAVIVIIPHKSEKDKEFLTILKMLCEENPRIIARRIHRYKIKRQKGVS